MNALIVNKEKIILKFSEDELALLCNALNEVCHGFKLSEFDSKIGAPIKEVKIILNFISDFYEKVKQIRLDDMKDL